MAPLACWFRNRWNWRKSRRARVKIGELRKLVVPLDELDADVDQSVRRMAEIAERSGGSMVLGFGYGKGEAVVVAAVHAPDRIHSLVESTRQYSDEQLLGADHSVDGRAAMHARNALLQEVRDIVGTMPKAGSLGN